MTRYADALARLEAEDHVLDTALGPRGTLDPARTRATPLVALGQQVFGESVSTELAVQLAESLVRIAEAVRHGFPDNLFWDFDYLAVCLLADGRAHGAGRLEESVREVVHLNELFGATTPIRFRYAHDFLYGFDWAKWVARAPAERARVGPYSLEFLRYLTRRGGELLDLIAADDAKYPRLVDDAARNPFGFSREPAAERTLHEDLARRGLVPVEAWRFDAHPSATQAYLELREQRARELGLSGERRGRGGVSHGDGTHSGPPRK